MGYPGGGEDCENMAKTAIKLGYRHIDTVRTFIVKGMQTLPTDSVNRQPVMATKSTLEKLFANLGFLALRSS